MRRLCVTVLFCLLPMTAMAQTRVLQWDQIGASSAATAQSWVYTVTDNGAPVAAASVTCSGTTTVTCQRPITLTPGLHRFVVTVSGNGITVSSDPLSSEDPTKPANLRITMNVAVNADGTAELLAFNVSKEP
jgi:hypothetical protein